jgi:hypothetical protein
MNKYPIDPAKVNALVESISQTDFWDNLLARPAGNEYKKLTGDELVEYLKGVDSVPKDMEIELAYGHHRLEAVLKAGMKTIDIPVKVIDNEIMLQIMANENKGDWASNMAVILETVRQVRKTLHEQVSEFDDFEDYMEVYSFFKTQKNFTAAKSIGNIGYRRIHEFLGETWSENDIRFADAVLKAIDEGIFDQEDVIHMPSIGVMNKFQTLCKAIRATTWPDYFHTSFIREASEIICEEGATVKIVGKAAAMVKKGNLPGIYLKKQKVQPFDLVKELRKLIEADEELTPDGLLELEGIGEYEGIEEVVEEVKTAIQKAEDRRDAAGGAVEEEAEGEETEDDDEAQTAIEAAEAEAGEVAEPEFPTTIDVPDEDADTRARIEMVIQTAEGVKFQFDQLKGKADDIDQELLEQLYPAFDKLYISATTFGLEALGKQYLIELMESAEENM